MDNKLTFSVEHFDLMDISNTELMKVKLKIVRNGNNTHNLPISWKTIESARPTLIGKPIVAMYDRKTNDFLGHEKNEIPVGAIISDSDIFYETDEDGYQWLCAYGYIWRRYCQDEVMILERDKIKNVSMEIICLEMGEHDSIESFIFSGVTLIGVQPAISGACAEVLEFAKISDYITKQFSDVKSITIDNTKEFAVNGSWSNPSGKLYKPILEASNKELSVHEAYGEVLKGYEDSPSSKLKYPHHVIRDGKLVVHIKGVEAMFSRAKQQGLTGKIIAHARKHYRELGLDQSNFAIFGLTQEDMRYLFASVDDMDDIDKGIESKVKFNQENINIKKEDHKMNFSKTPEMFSILSQYCGGQKFAVDEVEKEKFTLVDYCGKFMYAVDNESKKMFAIPYTYAETDTKVEADFEGLKPATMKCEAVETENMEEVDMAVMMSMLKAVCSAMGERFASELEFAEEKKEEMADVKPEDKEDNEEKMADESAKAKDDESKEDPKEEAKESPKEEAKEEDVEKKEMAATIAEMSVKMSELETETSELKLFKANVLAQEQTAKVEFALNEVAEIMPKDKIEEWRNKVTEFENVDSWSNAVKADAFQFSKGKLDIKSEGFTRMGLPYVQEGNKKHGLWD